jgi:hypothetical protein
MVLKDKKVNAMLPPTPITARKSQEVAMHDSPFGGRHAAKSYGLGKDLVTYPVKSFTKKLYG